MFLCAHARLGSSHARLGTYDVAFQGVGADWGGTEGIGTELRKIKKELGQLDNPSDPAEVCVCGGGEASLSLSLSFWAAKDEAEQALCIPNTTVQTS